MSFSSFLNPQSLAKFLNSWRQSNKYSVKGELPLFLHSKSKMTNGDHMNEDTVGHSAWANETISSPSEAADVPFYCGHILLIPKLLNPLGCSEYCTNDMNDTVTLVFIYPISVVLLSYSSV